MSLAQKQVFQKLRPIIKLKNVWTVCTAKNLGKINISNLSEFDLIYTFLVLNIPKAFKTTS